MRDAAVDLYCGLGGWAEGFLAEKFEVIGFDIERHDYGTGGYPAWLVLQDILTLHGSQLVRGSMRDRLRVIVASPPCQKYSYMAMPWTKAKALAAWYRADESRIVELNALFNTCFRIQREASEAADRYIPLIVENVKGAQPWVGDAAWHFGSYYLWGDIPALMPITNRCKIAGQNWRHFKERGDRSPHWTMEAMKVPSESGRRTDVGKGARFTSRDCGVEAAGVKVPLNGRAWYAEGLGSVSSKSSARAKASAMIAKIPFPLARHIARTFARPEA